MMITWSWSVWQDFAHYKSGVYQHLHGDYMGGHAVKLVGWGTTDEGVDYWVCLFSCFAMYLENTVNSLLQVFCIFHLDRSVHLCHFSLDYSGRNFFVTVFLFAIVQIVVNSWNRSWGEVIFTL